MQPLIQSFALSWQNAFSTFLHIKTISGLSKGTIEYYKTAFRLFERFHAEHNLSCSPLTCPREHIQTFLWWLGQRERPTTVHSQFRALRAFFHWLVKENLRPDNPVELVHPPKITEPLPKTVTEQQFVATIAGIDTKTFAGLRDVALFALAFDSGARLSELLNLKVGEIDLVQRFAKVKGKGGKERLIYFGATTANLLSRYITQRSLRFGSPSPSAFLFVTNDGRPLSKRQAEDWWNKAQRRINLNPLPFHGLRHGFARVWLLRGGDAFSLQLLMGHSTTEVTKRYVTLWGTDLQKLHAEKSPVDALNIRLRK